MSQGKIPLTFLKQASIMPWSWLTEDLQAINEKIIVLERREDGTISCAFVEEGDDVIESSQLRVIENDEIYNTGDLKWMAMLLGMDNMSSEWCIFFFLCRKQW